MRVMNLKKTESYGSGSQYSQNSNKSSGSNKGSKLPKEFTKQLRKSVINSKHKQMNVEDLFKAALNTFVCGICTINVDREDTLVINNEDCGHRFCTACFTQYAIYKINISEEVLCPDQNCNAKMGEHSELFAALPQQLRDKWKEQELWRQTISNPDIKICPNEHCKEGIVDLKKDPPECRKCLRKFCKECMMEAHEGPCDTNFQDHFREWKRCPKCRIFIQKDEGCNHMTCNCGHQFCFVCLSDWESSHYECIQGLMNRMFFNETRQMGSTTALIALIAVLLLFPLLLLGFALAIAVSIAVGVAAGVVVAPCVFLKEMGSKCCLCCIILIPFAMAIGAIACPIAIVVTTTTPFLIRNMTQYCNSVSFLKSSI